MRDFVPTHEIWVDGSVVLVALERGGGSAYTEAEMAAGARSAAWARLPDGSWTYQGAPHPAGVALVARAYVPDEREEAWRRLQKAEARELGATLAERVERAKSVAKAQGAELEFWQGTPVVIATGGKVHHTAVGALLGRGWFEVFAQCGLEVAPGIAVEPGPGDRTGWSRVAVRIRISAR